MALSLLWVVKYQAQGGEMHTVITSGQKSTWMSSRLKGNQLKGKTIKKALQNTNEMFFQATPQKAEVERQPLSEVPQVNELSALLTIKSWASPTCFLETNQRIYFYLYSKPYVSIPRAQLAILATREKNKQTNPSIH